MAENPSSKIKGCVSEVVNIDTTGLPSTYNDTKIVILPRDPVWLFVYWEVPKAKIEELKNACGSDFDAARLTVRVYDITDISFTGDNANRTFDVSVNPNSENWYINVGEHNRVWCADIGYIVAGGKFISVARSNPIAMPRQGVSAITDEQWGLLKLEFDKLFKLTGGNLSSAELVALMRARWEQITNLSLPSSRGALPSSSLSSMALPAQNREHPQSQHKNKNFWLKADTEIIIYGATEPDAELSVQGKHVPLSKDGSFTLRFYLKDGEHSYPIEATSSCKTMQKKITFVVKRETK
ncbi:MAG: DUF4912 domain-containing protein [Elusimicrobia bacterium]|nr:DUF4912 domain-containing protein [Elusimicrobiota bacterium]